MKHIVRVVILIVLSPVMIFALLLMIMLASISSLFDWLVGEEA